ncbi:unnamed protein product, partial [Polarella glacialis]
EWPEKYTYSGSFPPGFVRGLGTASYQIEGAYREGGRGASIWDTYTGANTVGMPGANCSYCCKEAPCPMNKGMVDLGATGNVASNSYNQHKTDVALMKSMGLQHYRFSISWPRMFPTGAASGEPNPEAVAHYNEFINELLAAGITPHVTLYHWDLPQALMSPPEISGWWARDAAGRPVGQILPNWLHYVDSCFSHFGDRVKSWITFNEAWTFTFLASGFGKAPNLDVYSDMKIDPYIAGHNVLNAHAAAVDMYRRKYKALQVGLIGITNNVDWKEPKTQSSADVAAADRAIIFNLGWFCDPIFGGQGDYPPEMRAVFGDRLPEFTAAERELLKGSADFFGLNHYATAWYAFSQEPGADTTYGAASEDGFPNAQSAWLYGSGWGFRKLLNWINRRYHHPIIYVTEGGWSMPASNAEAGVADLPRLLYYANYTAEMLKAINEDGVDVRGYFGWSLLDNFEWERGYVERFGTVFTDYNFGFDPNAPTNEMHQPTPEGQLRRRKESNCWLAAVWTSNSLVEPLGSTFCVSPTVFDGLYSDPKRIDCVRNITVDASGTSATVSGTDPAPNYLTCENIPNATVAWGPLKAVISGGTIMVNFTVKGGAHDLQGFWARATSSIEWGDGNYWTKAL